jgi:hypothetical protein
MISVGDYSIEDIADMIMPVKPWGFYRSIMRWGGQYMSLRVRVMGMKDSTTVIVRKLESEGTWNGGFKTIHYSNELMYVPLHIFKKHFHTC